MKVFTVVLLLIQTTFCFTIRKTSTSFKNYSKNRLIRNDWETLATGTTIRYFNPINYHAGASESDIWNNMGENITCTIDQHNIVHVQTPPGFDSSRAFKILTHGFSSMVHTDKTANVNAWMQTTNRGVNVILVDWPDFAWAGHLASWDDALYDEAARNSIDVGEFVGFCLAALTTDYGIGGDSFHLVGHSLGAHLMGKAGRTFHELTGQAIDRITGLDPAGPRFVDGPIFSALPELSKNKLNTASANFVDVIHTNGGLKPAVLWTMHPECGDLHQLGHVDFYPDGGSSQTGCTFGEDMMPFGICDHGRAERYFIHSIWEPKLFPSQACATVKDCNNEEVSDMDTVTYMGEHARDYYQEGTALFYNNIVDSHWNFYEHN